MKLFSIISRQKIKYYLKFFIIGHHKVKSLLLILVKNLFLSFLTDSIILSIRFYSAEMQDLPIGFESLFDPLTITTPSIEKI